MKVNRKTINALFRLPVQYEIPIYQRRYVWNEDNWRRLWSDIQDNIIDKSRRHFTGAIVTRHIENRPIEKYEVIDGQQRLTTFQIILCAFKHLCESGNYEDQDQLAQRVDRHIRNPKSAVDSGEETIEGDSIKRLVYKLIPTEYDSEVFRTLVKFEKSERFEINEDTRHIIKRAYVYFKGKIEEDANGNYERMKDLLNSFINRFEVAEINLGQEDQSQEIFLSINATGRQLSEFDYLRNYTFLRTKEKEKRDALYKKYWSKFERDPWTAEKLDEFFPVFLMAKLGPRVFHSNVKLFDLYQKEYREKLPEHQQNSKYELAQLELYAETYKELDDSDSKMGSWMQFYKDLGTYEEEDSYNSRVGSQHNRNITCMQSFVLHLKNELKRPYEELYTVFEILESYVARRLLVDTVDSRYAYETIEIFFRDIVGGSRQFTVENLVQYLNTDGKRKWISDKEVVRRFKESGNREQGAGRRFQGSLLFTERYILYRIENWKRRKAGENPLHFEQFFSTQERMLNSRILPRAAWASLGNTTFRKSDVVRPTIDSFKDEREFLSAPNNQTLLLNQEISQNDNWGAREIYEREQDLLSCFYKIWKPAEEFTRTPRQFARATAGRSLEPKFLKWISAIQSNAYQPARFNTSDGTKLLSQTKVIRDQVKCVDEMGNKHIFLKSDILFISSEAAWSDLQDDIPIRTSKRFQKPIKQLQVSDSILELAQDCDFSIAAVTHLGHKLAGRIDHFDDDAIYLQIKGYEVIVFKSGLLEIAIEGLDGVIKKWRAGDLFGYIEPSVISPGLPQEITVKSPSLDPTVISRKLLPGMRVKFDLEIVQKDEHSYFQASNVGLVTTEQLYQGKVKLFNPEKGYGFLISANYPDDIYMHKSQVIHSKDLNSLRDGNPVEFNIAKTIEGQNSVAINIKVKRTKPLHTG